jgi:protein O-GlcNAc transferase
MNEAPSITIGEQIEKLREHVKGTPGDSRAQAQLGDLLYQSGDLDNAKTHLSIATAIDPGLVGSYIQLGNICIRDCEYFRALGSWGVAQTFKPQDYIRLKMAVALPPIVENTNYIAIMQARLAQALKYMAEAELNLDAPARDSATLFYLAYHGYNDRAYYEALVNIYLKSRPEYGAVAPHCATGRDRTKESRIKIGFVSSFFFDHSIGRLFKGMIMGLDRKRFHVTVAFAPHRTDHVTEEIQRRVDRTIQLPLELAPAREKLMAQELDVVVYPELGMDVFALCLAMARVAPVQAMSWGHPVTSGIPNMDYFVSAEDLEGPGAEDHYSEKLFKLNTFGTCYTRPKMPESPKTRADFGMEEGVNYYMVAQYLFKLHPDFDQILGDVLRRDPKGYILLVHGARRRWSELLLARFKNSIPQVVDRIRFVPSQKHEDFLALMGCVDVSLDIPQFNGGNTTLEALSMGLPVVTMPTEFARGRYCMSIYKHMGYTDLVAETAEQYAELAVRLATDSEFMEQAQARIAETVPRAFDNKEAIREWERFFVEACAEKGINLPG